MAPLASCGSTDRQQSQRGRRGSSPTSSEKADGDNYEAWVKRLTAGAEGIHAVCGLNSPIKRFYKKYTTEKEHLSIYVKLNHFAVHLKHQSFPGDSDGKGIAYNAGDPGSIPGQEDLLEKEMATHSSIVAWKIPWTEEPGRLQSTRSQRVRHN